MSNRLRMTRAEKDALAEAIRGTFCYRESEEPEKPIIDAVPVVRCKDCKWSVPATNGKWQNGYRCKCSNSPVYETFWWLEGDWFCADGEREGSE